MIAREDSDSGSAGEEVIGSGVYQLRVTPGLSLVHLLQEAVDRFEKFMILAFHARVLLDVGPPDYAVLVYQKIGPV